MAVNICTDDATMAAKAKEMKAFVAEAVDEGTRAAERLMKSARRQYEKIEDVRDEAAHEVRRHPFRTIGFAVGAGMVLGAAGVGIGLLFARAKAAR